MTIPLSLPFAESYWVVPELFMAGEYPAGYDELVTRRRIQALIRVGITNFIDLTHSNDYMPEYHGILEDEANGYLKRVAYMNYPIVDRSVATQEQMIQVLNQIDQCMEKKEPVYLHCIAGIGRTGTVVGCYLVRHGTRTDEVMAMIKKLRGWPETEMKLPPMTILPSSCTRRTVGVPCTPGSWNVVS